MKIEIEVSEKNEAGSRVSLGGGEKTGQSLSQAQEANAQGESPDPGPVSGSPHRLG